VDTTLWRFESNGWPRERLHAIDLPYPLARDDDSQPQEGRTSTAEYMLFLAAEVERVVRQAGGRQVVLIGNSRGGNAIRNYIANGGTTTVSHAVLGGTPNHGLWADATNRPGSEFNGAGPFLMRLNEPKGPNGDEVTPGVRWMTIRSDNNDKFAQPDGAWIGAKGTPTNVSFDGPALKGARTSSSPASTTARRRSARRPSRPCPLHHRPRAAARRSSPETQRRARRQGLGLGLDNEPAAAATRQPAAGRRDGGGLRDRPATGERAGRGAPQDRSAPTACGAVRGRRRRTLRVRRQRAGLCDDAHLPLAVPALVAIVHLRAERIADADRDATPSSR
jgi:pimeloyl-ACP methyl ester carboxylesterase